jgi:hypothetical protein
MNEFRIFFSRFPKEKRNAREREKGNKLIQQLYNVVHVNVCTRTYIHSHHSFHFFSFSLPSFHFSARCSKTLIHFLICRCCFHAVYDVNYDLMRLIRRIQFFLFGVRLNTPIFSSLVPAARGFSNIITIYTRKTRIIID